MKPIRTLHIRFWLPTAILLVFTLSFLISAVKQRQMIETDIEQRSWNKVQQSLAATSTRVGIFLRLGNRGLVADEVADYGVDLNVEALVLLDDEARVIESTRRDWIGREAAGVVAGFDRKQFDAVQRTNAKRLFFNQDHSRIFGYQPVAFPPTKGEIRSNRIGVLMLNYDLRSEKIGLWGELLRQRLLIWSLSLGLVLIPIWIFIARISRPLHILTSAVRRFGAGDRDVTVLIEGKGELAELSEAWNRMHAELMLTLNQLEQSNENLEVTLFSIGDAVIATDAQGKVTRMNAVAQKLTGWALEEAVGLPMSEVFRIVSAETRLAASDPVAQVLATGEVVGLANHTVLIARDGREYHIADSAAPIRDRDSRIIGVVLVFRDVTEEYALRDDAMKNELMLRTIVETQPECVKLLDRKGALIQMNRAGLRMIEADSLEQVLGRNVGQIVLPAYREAFNDLCDRVFQGESGTLEFEIEGLKGGHRWLETHAVPMRDTQGKITALLGITRDVSARKQADIELRIAATAFETQEGIMVTDADNRILRINRAFSRITGYTEAEVLGRSPSFLKSGRHDLNFYREMWQTIKQEQYWQGEIWNRRKSGEVFPEWLTITGIRNDAGQLVNYVASFSDISDFKAQEAKIHNLAFYDPLTGLPNRRLLYDRLQQSLAASARNKAYGAILFIDLDNFKMINDTRGHDVGDLLLIDVARRLKDCVRAEDTVARLGGDEFVVMLDNLSDDEHAAGQQVEVVGDKILQIFSNSFTINGQAHHTTPSIGVCLYHNHEFTVDELLKRADSAMYKAKQSGRNALCYFDPNMQSALEARLLLEAEMRRALPLSDFKLYFQKQVNDAGKVVGAEVLLRWEHPERGLVPPSEFIPLAEETGLIVQIGEWVLEEACAQLKRWESNPLTSDLQLAVNVSARQFRQGTFADVVANALLMSGADPNRLKLELTESLVLENIEDTIAKMHKLKDMGVGFSMDDFGTGQSSLTYLKKLPLDQLKIDQSFVSDVTEDADDAIIVQTIIAMAINLDLDVIAEGVETEEQRSFLERSGCQVYQGYLFGRPVPIEEFEASLGR